MSQEKKPIKTGKVQGRRTLRYQSLDELWGDAQRLAENNAPTMGNWSQGQIYEHLARAFNISIDGVKPFPAPMRLILNLVFKKRFLNKGLPAGFPAPADFVADDTTSTQSGLESLRLAIQRQNHVTERAPHPGFGTFTAIEWEQFHLRHAEMHMSFIQEPKS